MKKIMFNDKYGLTEAVLEKRKTQTRRVVDEEKNSYFIDLLSDENYMSKVGTLSYDDEFGEFRIDDAYECTKLKSKYKVGEIVAVAQNMCDIYAEFDLRFCKKDTKELMKKFGGSPCFNNKMFVKASEMPHQIRITKVRVERLQDISEEDCLKEGIIKKWHLPAGRNYYYIPNVDVKSTKDVHNTPREAYAKLIEKVSGKDIWKKNPYVFVYDFELLK